MPYPILDRRTSPNPNEMIGFTPLVWFEQHPWSVPFPVKPRRVVWEDAIDYYEEGSAFSINLVRLDFRHHPSQWRVFVMAALPSDFLNPPPQAHTKLPEREVAFGWNDHHDHRTWLAFDGLTAPTGNDASRYIVPVLGSYPRQPFLEEMGIADPFKSDRGTFEVHSGPAFWALLLPGREFPVKITHAPGLTALYTDHARIDLSRAPACQPRSEVDVSRALATLTYTRGENCWVLATMHHREPMA